ncbi:alpha/beta hydrolase [Bacillus suaedaesalsae]|uniref:Esterase family protein n=1 Tax=Bacillus suaedaesalsae TaxID=2810349 RepID=A0ABS2DL30_9BACI|nr:esterase family protein [Bacillus suaedaesalsae]MBM6618178.1 esterase family protein [Bacillus suaedaesalsae]
MEQQKGTIEEITFTSSSLGEDLSILIYKPANFSTLYKYHLIITQDGQDYFNLGRIARVTEDLLQNKEIPNTIIVGIPYPSVEERRRRYHPNGEKHKAYIRFLSHELIPYLDQTLPTFQMGRGRVLMGDSLGGTISLLTALQYPHTFGKVVMQSPFINSYVKDQVEGFSSPHLLQIYQVIGTKETAVETTNGQVKDFVKPNRELAEIIKSRGFQAFYEEFEGDHTWTYWQPDLIQALQFILND